MVSRIVLTFLASAAAASGAIDFSPVPFEVEFEGARYPQPGFVDGATTVTFAPPAGWVLNGAGPVLKLQPKDAELSAARIETRAVAGEEVASEPCLKSCKEELVSMLPPDAAALRWEPVEANPVLLNRHQSARIEVAYKVFGQNFRATLLVCNLADQQLRFLLLARDHDFPRVYGEFRRSLYTWQGLK